MRKVKVSNPTLVSMFVAVILALLALWQNRYGQYSDIRQFYIMHFSDGQNLWPFSYHTLLNSTEQMHPVEYPALTGLVMWLLSFVIPLSAQAPFHYYWVSGILNAVLFGVSAHLLERMSSKRVAYYFMGSLAVLYSLNRNWDIWAVTPMLAAVLMFDCRSYFKSSLLLAVAIAMKFFPIVLLLPIAIYFIRKSKFRELFLYVGNVAFSWFVINLPFMLVNFGGWAYFYKFSLERGLGSASIYNVLEQLGVSFSFNQLHFYILNLFIFVFVGLILIRIPVFESISPYVFLALFAFTIFNKQYSMQYIIWLTPFALLSIHTLQRKFRKRSFWLFFSWQIFEFIFQFAFFQNLLTNVGKQRNLDLASVDVSSAQFAVIATIRYVLIASFFINLVKASLSPIKPSSVEKVCVKSKTLKLRKN